MLRSFCEMARPYRVIQQTDIFHIRQDPANGGQLFFLGYVHADPGDIIAVECGPRIQYHEIDNRYLLDHLNAQEGIYPYGQHHLGSDLIDFVHNIPTLQFAQNKPVHPGVTNTPETLNRFFIWSDPHALNRHDLLSGLGRTITESQKQQYG